MISVLQAVRVAITDFRQSLDQTSGQGRDALFVARDALRDVSERLGATNAAHLQPLVEAMQHLLEGFLRTGELDVEAGTESLGRFAEVLLALTDGPGGIAANPLAASYLGMSGGDGLSAGGAIRRLDNNLHAGPRETISLPNFLDEAPAVEQAPAPQPVSMDGYHPTRKSAPLNSGEVTRLLSTYGEASETRLGQVLLRQRLIDTGELDRALALQQISKRKLGEVLVAMELIGVESLNRALERQRFETLNLVGDHVPQGEALPKEPAHLRLLGSDGE